MIIVGTMMALMCLAGLIVLALHIKKKQGNIPVFAAKTILGGFIGFFTIMGALLIASIFNVSPAFASEAASVAGALPAEAYATAFLGAGLSVGLACIGTGIATGMSASAAIGAVSENPKMLGTSLLFVGLSEGIAIYGVIIAIMILGKLG
ncbi:MAG: ATP synthase subunit C [Brevinema sp.]